MKRDINEIIVENKDSLPINYLLIKPVYVHLEIEDLHKSSKVESSNNFIEIEKYHTNKFETFILYKPII